MIKRGEARNTDLQLHQYMIYRSKAQFEDAIHICRRYIMAISVHTYIHVYIVYSAPMYVCICIHTCILSLMCIKLLKHFVNSIIGSIKYFAPN